MKNKKIYMLLLTALLGMTTASAFDFSAKNSDGVTIYYNFKNDGTGFGLEVALGPYQGNIVIPDSVMIDNAYYKVKSIAPNAFAGTPIKSIKIPSSVTNIGYRACAGCTLLESVDLPDNATSIITSMFQDCTNLKNFNFKNVTKIGPSAFENSGITSLVVPPDGSSMKIFEYAFYNCKNLKKIDANISSIDIHAFQGCGIEELVLDSNVKSVGYNAFANCDNLKRVKIASETIGDYAFCECYQLNNVTLDVGVSYVEHHAFERTNIKNLKMAGPINRLGLRSLPNLDLDYFELQYNSNFEYHSISGKINILKLSPDLTSVPGYLIDGVRINNLISPRMTPPSISLEVGGPTSYISLEEKYKDIDVYVPKEALSLYKRAWGPYMKSITGVDDINDLSGVDDAIADSEDAAENADAPYYDLMGRQVANPGPGIYIHAGKKVIIK